METCPVYTCIDTKYGRLCEELNNYVARHEFEIDAVVEMGDLIYHNLVDVDPQLWVKSETLKNWITRLLNGSSVIDLVNEFKTSY